MHVIWFKKDGEWHWVEVFLKDTADVVIESLNASGYTVGKPGFDPKKHSVIEGV